MVEVGTKLISITVDTGNTVDTFASITWLRIVVIAIIIGCILINDLLRFRNSFCH